MSQQLQQLVHDPARHRLGKREPKAPHAMISEFVDIEAVAAKVPVNVVNSVNQTVALAMYDNDSLGDCTCAGVANSLRVNSDGTEQLADHDVVAAYIAVTTEEGNPYDPATGANADAGCAEIDVLDYWVKSGVGGDKLLAHAGVDMKNATEVKAVTYLFGSIYPGWQLSTAQQTQEVWDVAHGAEGKPGSWGGHCAPIFDIYGEWPGGSIGGVSVPAGPVVTIGTWGAYKPATMAFVPHYADEGHALITDAWLARNKDNPALNMAALEAYMKRLKPEQ